MVHLKTNSHLTLSTDLIDTSHLIFTLPSSHPLTLPHITLTSPHPLTSSHPLTSPSHLISPSHPLTHLTLSPCLTLSPYPHITLISPSPHITSPSHLTFPCPLHHQTISGMTSPVQSVTFNNSENWVAAGSKSGVIKVFDCEENRGRNHLILSMCSKLFHHTVVRTISGHTAAICSLDFHRYGDILASGSMDTNLKVWIIDVWFINCNTSP